MSLDPSASLQIFSPTGSGRSSPSPRATRHNTEEGMSLRKDKGFRRYETAVERSLALWDAAQQEWADYISFLQRLLKTSGQPTEVPAIPHSELVALRLAQCLNPTLPSGVHQKALDVYGYIFSRIGLHALARDLQLYLPGLAPVLSFASLSVRPLFLSLLEDYILRLDGTALRPALKALILSLLPGLEDETSEDFDRIIAALDKLRNVMCNPSDDDVGLNSEAGSSHFWQCFFLATITNTSRRQGALAYLVRRLPKFSASSGREFSSLELPKPSDAPSIESEAAITPEPGLLIRCFEAGLTDAHALIQRGFLDMLVTHLPLDAPVLQQRIEHRDLQRLVGAAVSVVSRRDMSLNRRLWAWLLGPEPAMGAEAPNTAMSPTDEKRVATDMSSYHAAYFSQHGLRALTRNIMEMIHKPTLLPSDRARPFRICLSLMDRAEIGGFVVPEIFLPALQSIQSYSEVAAKEQVDEVLRSASVFFDGVESGLIWGKLVYLVLSALDIGSTDAHESIRRLKLARFILARFNVREEEMLVHHMPLMVLSALSTLNLLYDSSTPGEPFPADLIDLAFQIVDFLVQELPDRAFLADVKTGDPVTRAFLARERILEKIKEFYEDKQGNLEFYPARFTAAEIGQSITHEASVIFFKSLNAGTVPTLSEIPSRILASLILKARRLDVFDESELVSRFQGVLSNAGQRDNSAPFQHLMSMTTVLASLQTARPSHPFFEPSRLPTILNPLISALWRHLDPVMPKFHVEAARCILQLHAISASHRIVEGAIAFIVSQEASGSECDAGLDAFYCGQRFSLLWTHVMYELSLQTEKRGSISRRASGIANPLSSFTEDFPSMLSRPLLLLLDSLAKEGTELSSFMRTWLQTVPSLNKVFEILITHLQSLSCLRDNKSLAPARVPQEQPSRRDRNDTEECLYYLTHILNIIKEPSPLIWAVLAEEPVSQQSDTPDQRTSMQGWIVRACLTALTLGRGQDDARQIYEDLSQTSVRIIQRIYRGPYAASLRDMELEVRLMDRIRLSSPVLQSLLLDAILLALKIRIEVPETERSKQEQKPGQHQGHRSRMSLSVERISIEEDAESIPPPPQLVDCLKYGFSSPQSRQVLGDWVHFLAQVLPLFSDAIFQNLLPLVECFCKQINTTFEELKGVFGASNPGSGVSPESTLIHLINGLEQLLAAAHQRLRIQETKTTANKSPEHPQGFFGTMVSGVFSSETIQTRVPTANSRLTVLLCFQDTVRICFTIWSWGGYGSNGWRPDGSSIASFAYTSLRMRNRARRILEHLFAAEALECLETLIALWTSLSRDDSRAAAVTGLLNVLNGSKPKHTIPAIFNAVYSRTNPNALDPNRTSTLTSELADTDLVAFLVDYTKSLEDDAMDEIWSDCTVFLRDVLANPLPHRQILPPLLEFTAVIGRKVDNTNFGEQRKMRKELADIFVRILTAVFTTRSMGFLQDASQIAVSQKTSTSTNGGSGHKRAADVVSILNTIIPYLPVILVDNDRVSAVVTNISQSVIGPTLRAKGFPENVPKSVLDLIHHLARVSQSNKFWRKEVTDAFNDPRFFNTPLPLLKSSWLPILEQWSQADKERLPELLSRITAPTTAGIMFGVGAASARQEADRKTQLTLRRIALLVLAAQEDSFTANLPQMADKLVELLSATPASSPSSITRAEVLILLRAIVLKTSSVHLAPLWPIINAELTSGLTSLLPDAKHAESYNNAGIIQICKLLDQLVVLDPDEFQLIEWHFLCDTIDAVYRPASVNYMPFLADEVSEVLSSTSTHTSHRAHTHTHSRSAGSLSQIQNPQTSQSATELKRRLFLDPLINSLEKEEGAEITQMARQELLDRVVRHFLSSLAIGNFEATYGGGQPDYEGVWESIVADARGVE
ncbi:cellular morphogenesis regulator dopa [Westerdykella ornata]|uniref:Cellular morphogenesis regulator dopa n=1 Tax=Westerdykella ornata TaxID=318751 RepID=A0A6A6JMT3_WESOR|nr:cellular morphogenesis regulator dopa [Westerdykella ornata]KAF2277544.1 cellular morphogenesis regulator dopa [Westerdykella ornata]